MHIYCLDSIRIHHSQSLISPIEESAREEWAVLALLLEGTRLVTPSDGDHSQSNCKDSE